MSLAGINKIKTAQRKTLKSGQKEQTHREGPEPGRFRASLPIAGDVKNDTAGL